VNADTVADEGPLLGLATTRQLLEELAVRFEVPTPEPIAKSLMFMLLDVLNAVDLDYRTVDA
jgi:hypothetical protein